MMSDKKQGTATKRQPTGENSQENGAQSTLQSSRNSERNSDSDNNSETLQKLASLSEALQNDVSSADPDAAFKLIDEWHDLVNKVKGAEFKEIARGLKEVQKLLQQDDAGHDLGELLSHLGALTSDSASEAEKGLKNPLRLLGKQLSEVGISLSKEEDKHHLEALGSLVETLDQEASTIDSKSSVDEIEQWHDLLHKSEDDSLKSIAGKLKDLKKLLKGTKTKGADISEVLIELGEQTTEAASIASRGFKGAIRELGKALIKFGKSIE